MIEPRVSAAPDDAQALLESGVGYINPADLGTPVVIPFEGSYETPAILVVGFRQFMMLWNCSAPRLNAFVQVLDPEDNAPTSMVFPIGVSFGPGAVTVTTFGRRTAGLDPLSWHTIQLQFLNASLVGAVTLNPVRFYLQEH